MRQHSSLPESSCESVLVDDTDLVTLLADSIARDDLQARLRQVHEEYRGIGPSITHAARARDLRTTRTEIAAELCVLAGHELPAHAGVLDAVLGIWDGEAEFALLAAPFLQTGS